MESEILTYRKPAYQFESFSDSVSIVFSGKDVNIKPVYDCYPPGYNFQDEQEWRIAQIEDNKYINFSERDLTMVIVPNNKSKEKLTTYFEKEWDFRPNVQIFPK